MTSQSRGDTWISKHGLIYEQSSLCCRCRRRTRQNICDRRHAAVVVQKLRLDASVRLVMTGTLTQNRAYRVAYLNYRPIWRENSPLSLRPCSLPQNSQFLQAVLGLHEGITSQPLCAGGRGVATGGIYTVYGYLYPQKSAQVNFFGGKNVKKWRQNGCSTSQKTLYPQNKFLATSLAGGKISTYITAYL